MLLMLYLPLLDIRGMEEESRVNSLYWFTMKRILLTSAIKNCIFTTLTIRWIHGGVKLAFYFPMQHTITCKGRRDYQSQRNQDHAVSKIFLTTRLFVTVIL